MDIIANDLPRFDGDINDYQRAHQSLVNHYQMLVAHMNDLNNMWEGEAHNQFMETFSVDSNRTSEMINLLKEILDELRYAHGEYTNCENTVASIIDSIAV